MSLGNDCDIIHYSDKVTKYTKGVYTLYDKDFDDSYLIKILDLNILISDDLDKFGIKRTIFRSHL